MRNAWRFNRYIDKNEPVCIILIILPFKKQFFFNFFKLNSFQLFENTSATLLVIFSLNKYHVSYLNMQILFKRMLLKCRWFE